MARFFAPFAVGDRKKEMMPTTEETDPAVFAFWLRFWRRVVAVLEVAGGLFGIYILMFGRVVETSRVIFLLAFTLFVASVWGGILLVLGRRGGVAVSLAVQAVQLFQIVTAGLVYSFVSGLQLIVGFRQTDSGPEPGFSFHFPAYLSVFLNPSPEAMPAYALTGINVIAVLSIICLLYVRAAEREAIQSVDMSAVTAPPMPEGIWPPAPEP